MGFFNFTAPNNQGQNNGQNGANNQNAKQVPTVGFGELFKRLSLKNLLITLGVITAVIIAFQIYFGLMSFSIDNIGLRIFIIVLALIWSIPLLYYYLKARESEDKRMKAFNSVHWAWKIPAGIAVVITVLSICLAIFTTPMFLAKDYNQMVTVTQKSGQNDDKYYEFKNEVPDYYNDEDAKVAIIDKSFAALLGEKVLGESTGGYASQFIIRDYTLINYNDSLYWVGALEPKGFFQWTSNTNGSPGYVLVDATKTGDDAKAELVQKDKNGNSVAMKYTPGAYFHQDAERKLYFGAMANLRYGDLNLELDDNGVPYYTQAIYKKEFGITSGDNITGILTLNAVTGEVNKYTVDKAPAWIDRIQAPSLVMKQLDYWGEYSHGYFNTWFAKKEVNNTTAGYNYVYVDGRLCLTTGITAKASDQALIGMILTDTRTKETVMYNMAGATEYAAQKSAEGIPSVQAARLTATFPALINFNGVPTYYMGLKDSAGNIKMYAFVNVEEYTSKLVAASTPEEAKRAYYELVKDDSKPIIPPVEGVEKDIVITDIISYNMNGNTMFSINNDMYTASINIDGGTKLLRAREGQTIKCIVNSNNVITKIISIS